jgi:hypothetical protein
VTLCKSNNFCEFEMVGFQVKSFYEPCLHFLVIINCICVYQSAIKAVEKVFPIMKGMCTKQVFNSNIIVVVVVILRHCSKERCNGFITSLSLLETVGFWVWTKNLRDSSTFLFDFHTINILLFTAPLLPVIFVLMLTCLTLHFFKINLFV